MMSASSVHGLSVAERQSVLELVRAAGQAIMAVYNEPQHAQGRQQKADGSPLTRADLAAHRVLAQGLSRLTPGVPVVSEEDVHSWPLRTAEGRFWLIDPLDGTREFVDRNDQFTVNVAWVVQGRACWGAVGAPALDRLYWGGPGDGAWAADTPGGCLGPTQSLPPPSQVTNTQKTLRVVASRSHLNPDTQQFLDTLGPVDLVQAGSSLKFCRLAEGRADLYPRLAPTCEWDTAAAQAVLEGAGGCVQDLHGQPLRYGKPEVLNPFFIAARGPGLLPAH